MRASWRIAIPAGLACMSQPLQARDREVRNLQPSSKWVVDYAEDSCSLGRNFGEGDQKVSLIFEQFAPGEWFAMKLAGKEIKPRSLKRPIEAVMRFGPTEAESEITGLAGTIGELPAYFVDGSQRLAPYTESERRAWEEAMRKNLRYDAPPLGADREKAVTWFELRKVLRFDLVLPTGRMDRPLDALRQCTWDLVRGWGFDVEQQKNLSRQLVAKHSSSTWFSHKDYPSKMLAGGHESIIHFRLIVDERGNPASCHIQASTRPKDFDDLVCRILMQRARFHPALDAAGKPVRSYWWQTIGFRIAS